MQSEILDAGAEVAGDVNEIQSESHGSAELDRLRRNGEVLDRIEAHLRQFEEAFVRLENLKTEEQKLAAALDATCIEEKKILSDESASEKQATERLLKLPRTSRHSGRTRQQRQNADRYPDRGCT